MCPLPVVDAVVSASLGLELNIKGFFQSEDNAVLEVLMLAQQ